jgi:hypothetical protein
MVPGPKALPSGAPPQKSVSSVTMWALVGGALVTVLLTGLYLS